MPRPRVSSKQLDILREIIESEVTRAVPKELRSRLDFHLIDIRDHWRVNLGRHCVLGGTMRGREIRAGSLRVYCDNSPWPDLSLLGKDEAVDFKTRELIRGISQERIVNILPRIALEDFFLDFDKVEVLSSDPGDCAVRIHGLDESKLVKLKELLSELFPGRWRKL